jgi:hypothetical protein
MAAPRRPLSGQPSRLEFLVFVEGLVTEEDYLTHWHRRYRRSASVEIHEFRGTPMALVEKASQAKATNERAERRGRGRAHDQVWCVFDVDEHPRLGEAIELAAQEDINLAISNPCIELWFLLHFEPQSAYIERAVAQRSARQHLGCEKGLTEAALVALEDGFEIARERAQRLEEKHRGDGTPPPGNPSSSLWRLIDKIVASE